MRIRKMDIADTGDVAAPADAADTWTRPILPIQCARRISYSGSKDRCTSQTSQVSGKERRRHCYDEQNQETASFASERIRAFTTLRFCRFHSIQWNT
jgi:hypothetical protein